MFHNIKYDAIFVADSHYNQNHQEFLTFLKKLNSGEITATQLILMGDNFDFISGECKYFIKINQELIDILNILSQNMEILYLEGNHDYNMQVLFPNIKVIKRENQPYICKTQDGKSIALSHGDNFIDWKYDLYCSIIRNSTLLKFLNILDFNFSISKKIENALLGKSICHDMKNFEDLVKKRVKNYKTDLIIEGHYHQGKSYNIDNKLYVNIPSLCCSKEFSRFTKDGFKKEGL
jgi:UDP-2,3-diacylglucosamine hydrolase